MAVDERGDLDTVEAAPQARPAVLATFYCAALVCAWLALHLSGLFAVAFHTKGEPREALPVQDILHGERFVLPLRNAHEMPRKPPLFYWLGAASATLLGRVDEGVVRLPSAVQSLVAAIIVLLLAAAAGRPLAGFMSALALLTSFEWLRSSVTARIDMTLALGTTASFAGLYLARQHPGRFLPLVLFYGGMIWGTLAKGPIGIVLPSLCLGATLLVDNWRRWAVPILATAAIAFVAVALGAPRFPLTLAAVIIGGAVLAYLAIDQLRPLRPLLGYAVVFGVTAAWYGLAANTAGEQFIRTQLLAENFGRFLGNASIDLGHQHGPVYLAGTLLTGALPWTLFLPGVVAVFGRSHAAPWRQLLNFAAIWIVVVFAFFAASSSKRSVYLLPLYPAVSLFIGSWLADLVTRGEIRPWSRLWTRALGIAVTLVFGALAVLLAMDGVGVPLRQSIVHPILVATTGLPTAAAIAGGFDQYGSALVIWSSAAAAAGLLLVYCTEFPKPRLLVFALLATVLILELFVQRGVMPAVAPASSRLEFVQRLSSTAGERPITMTPTFDYATAFYLGGAVPVIDLDREPPAGAITLVPRDRWRQMSGDLRSRYETIPGLNASKQGNQAAQVAIQRVPR